MHIESSGISPPWSEPQVANAEDRLRSGRWLSTIALSGDVIIENNIHTINAVLWLVGRRPVSAIGRAASRPQEPPRRFPRGLPPDLRVRRRPGVDAHRPVVEQSGGLGLGTAGLWRDGHGGRQLPRQVVPARRPQALRRATMSRASTTKARSATSPRSTRTSCEDDSTTRPCPAPWTTCSPPCSAARPPSAAAALTMEELLKENKETKFDLSGFKV